MIRNIFFTSVLSMVILCSCKNKEKEKKEFELDLLSSSIYFFTDYKNFSESFPYISYRFSVSNNTDSLMSIKIPSEGNNYLVVENKNYSFTSFLYNKDYIFEANLDKGSKNFSLCLDFPITGKSLNVLSKKYKKFTKNLNIIFNDLSINEVKYSDSLLHKKRPVFFFLNNQQIDSSNQKLMEDSRPKLRLPLPYVREIQSNRN